MPKLPQLNKFQVQHVQQEYKGILRNALHYKRITMQQIWTSTELIEVDKASWGKLVTQKFKPQHHMTKWLLKWTEHHKWITSKCKRISRWNFPSRSPTCQHLPVLTMCFDGVSLGRRPCYQAGGSGAACIDPNLRQSYSCKTQQSTLDAVLIKQL